MLNQYDLTDYLKKKRKYMTTREIAKETKTTIPATQRKLNRLCPRLIEKRVKWIIVGRNPYKRPVSFYRCKA